jgi:hypothetical protein
MPIQLVQRRTIILPTLLGWILLGVVIVLPVASWLMFGERFLAATDRTPSKILVVEGWISVQGLHAATEEFRSGGYDFVVATGGLTGEKWSERRWDYSEEAEEQFLRRGISPNQVIRAPSRNSDVQRTFEMAAAAYRALEAKGITTDAIVVFTRGSHARRSRLVYQKVFGSKVRVGVVSWKPPHFEEEAWWRSSDRSEDFLKESVGYVFELLLNAGRSSNRPG